MGLPLTQRNDADVWLGDCLDIAQYHQDSTFSLIVTSTPYPKMAGFDLSVEEFMPWWLARMEAWTPKLTPNGIMIQVINFPRRDDGFYDDRLLMWIPGMFGGLGYNCVHAMPWVKGNSPPAGNHAGYDRSGYEMVYIYTRAQAAADYIYNKQYADYAAKTRAKAASGNMRQNDVRGSMGGGHDRLNPAGAGLDDVLRYSPTGGIEQFRPRVGGGVFPIGLVDRLILTYSNVGQKIGDIFCGAGTVLVRGRDLGRIVVGVDIDQVAVDTTVAWLDDPSWGGKIPRPNGKSEEQLPLLQGLV